jgi:hypothetical protein
MRRSTEQFHASACAHSWHSTSIACGSLISSLRRTTNRFSRRGHWPRLVSGSQEARTTTGRAGGQSRRRPSAILKVWTLRKVPKTTAYGRLDWFKMLPEGFRPISVAAGSREAIWTGVLGNGIQSSQPADRLAVVRASESPAALKPQRQPLHHRPTIGDERSGWGGDGEILKWQLLGWLGDAFEPIGQIAKAKVEP